MKEISKAIIAVMKEVKNIEKGMSVGTGKSSYKAISDSMVRGEVKDAMTKNGLCILPISVQATTKVDRWEEADSYNNGAIKTKQSVFTETHTKYLLLHESGESLELAGYGHGVDSQDKGAGKATTYALKNAILDTFLIIKGDDVDTDKNHSDDLPVPPKAKTKEEIFELVKKDIANAKSIEECQVIDKKIDSSTKIDESQKIDLSFILQEKILTFDPTVD